MRAMKTQEEREVRDLMGELEKRKELELRQRMEKEMVKRELRSLDAVQMKQLEQDRRAEIAQLARERNALKNREDDLMGEVKKLESRMQEQELKFRKAIVIFAEHQQFLQGFFQYIYYYCMSVLLLTTQHF